MHGTKAGSEGERNGKDSGNIIFWGAKNRTRKPRKFVVGWDLIIHTEMQARRQRQKRATLGRKVHDILIHYVKVSLPIQFV